jgi:NifU-like protein involved in Fe-S cluster formation
MGYVLSCDSNSPTVRQGKAMSDNAQMMKLYSARILALAADIPHQGRLDAPQTSVKRRSPLCGSTVTVDLDMADGRVTRFAQEVKACALGQAAAAILGQVVIGKTASELTHARAQLHAMLTENGPVPDGPFTGYEVLTPAREYRNRHASILLALDAAVEATQTLSAQAASG